MSRLLQRVDYAFLSGTAREPEYSVRPLLPCRNSKQYSYRICKQFGGSMGGGVIRILLTE